MTLVKGYKIEINNSEVNYQNKAIQALHKYTEDKKRKI
jgi:hypothetical protein